MSTGDQYYSAGTTTDLGYITTTNYTQVSPMIQQDEGEGFDFKKLIAFRGLKIIEVIEDKGLMKFKCKRGNRIFTIETNTSYVELLNVKKKSLIQVGWKFVNKIWDTINPGTTTHTDNSTTWDPSWQTTTNVDNWTAYAGTDTAIGVSTIC